MRRFLRRPISVVCVSCAQRAATLPPSSSEGQNLTASNTPTSQQKQVAVPTVARPEPTFPFNRYKHGIGGGVDSDFTQSNGTLDLFMKPESQKEKKVKSPQLPDGMLPCDVPNSPAANYADKVAPKPVVAAAAAPPPPPSVPPPKPIQRSSSLPKPSALPHSTPASSQKRIDMVDATPASLEEREAMRIKEAEHYYTKVAPPTDLPSKEQLWSTLKDRKTTVAEELNFPPPSLGADESDYIRMDEEMKEHDFFRHRYSEFFFRDETMRRKWCSIWNLSMSLNKARWQVHEVMMEKGTKSTGASMRTSFWKEACHEIVEKRSMVRGQFIDGHPVLRPFASTIQSTPNLTKSFIRGWVDARLKVNPQPANMKQLMDYFDKFYGYYFNTLLELVGVKDEHAEHMMMHVGRAVGITLHCVMFWKKYAALSTTMLPADLCADRSISVALLRNTALASRDIHLRNALNEMMSVAKTEMIHAEELAKKCPVEAYPVAFECLYPNFYLGFLQKNNFNVSSYFADQNIENPAYWWYCYKKQHQWIRNHSIPLLLAEAAPLPFTNICIGHRGSVYKMPASDPQTQHSTQQDQQQQQPRRA